MARTRQYTTYSTLVGQVLAQTRRHTGVTQTDIAHALDLSQSAWSKIERGAVSINVEQLRRAASVLGCSPSQILKAADDATNSAQRRGIRIEPQRRDDVPVGLVLAGIAVLTAIAAAAVAKNID